MFLARTFYVLYVIEHIQDIEKLQPRHWKMKANSQKIFSRNAIIDWILTIILSLLLFLTPK